MCPEGKERKKDSDENILVNGIYQQHRLMNYYYPDFTRAIHKFNNTSMQQSTLLNTEYSTDVQQEPIEHRFNPYQGKYTNVRNYRSHSNLYISATNHMP